MAMDFGNRSAGQVIEPNEVAAKMGGALLGREARNTAIGGETRPSLQQTIQAVREAGKRLDGYRNDMLGLADIAEAVAQRLGGPYPTDAGNAGSRGDAPEREALSTVEEAYRSAADLHPRISALENPAQRIARALDAISRAIG